ncbi:hypothetical protein BDN67DRAFT_1014489 [Paxillus ammoniavirescens]|nr:hypothetical protein BDN67DRAFT_1014489 [Paxillus ammoniavirescens]
MDDNHAKVDNNKSKPPQDPVGTTDGNERRPNEPTEPPDEKEGEQGVDSESTVESTVERVESKTSSQVDQPGGRGVERETRSKEVKDKLGGKVEDDECQRDGRMSDTGDAMSSTSCDSGRVEAGLLAENEEGQQRNDMRKASKHVPGPPTPHPSNTTRPTHLTNPPRHRGRLKMTPTDVSQPERTESTGCDGNGTELLGECPRATRPKDEGHQGPYVDADTVDTTYAPTSRKLPNRVITPA